MKTTMSGFPIGVCPPPASGDPLGPLGDPDPGALVVGWVAPGEPRVTGDGEDSPGSDDGGVTVLAQAPTVTIASAMAMRRRRIERSLPRPLTRRQRDAED
jgi:hypothetical protein